jgi:tRNA/tmRNA/rRNA uracil-C5-methylase (TrmA/RlmC/RlmD family)
LLGAYEIADLRIYDFFPHTPHIEVLAVLEGRRS